MPRALRYALIVALSLGGVLLFLLASASNNTQAFDRNYAILLGVNGAIAALLFALVVALIARLVRRLRAGRFGARLMARFALAFALMGVLPGALIYVVSVQFLSRSIESWFDIRVDRALESGLALGRAVLETQRDDLTNQARSLAVELADLGDTQLVRELDRLRERVGVADAVVVNLDGRVLAASSARRTDLAMNLPAAASLRAARVQRSFAAIEGDELATEPTAGLRTRVIVPIPEPAPNFAPAEPARPLADGRAALRLAPPAPPPATPSTTLRIHDQRFLQLIQPVPANVAANARALRAGYADYQELSVSRAGLRRMFGLTLTLALLLAVFAAMTAAVLLATSMTAPLVQLAAGTRAVAEGDFRPVREFRGRSELNVLTRSFNAMIRELGLARDVVETRSRELENARAYLERVLANLSAGVIVLDDQLRLVTANFGASRILGIALAGRTGERLAELMPALAETIASSFADQTLAATPRDSWQQQVQVPRGGAPSGAEPLALLLRGSKLPLDGGPGFVVVFDDITQVISAQRAVAWGEVARRLAHEIKNPLTPIQLAAERLQMKLAGRLLPADADILVRGATTIVNQVAAMKKMVDEFRDYARLPPMRPTAVDLNALVEEVGALYDAVSDAAPLRDHGAASAASAQASAPARFAARVELALAPDLPLIEGDPVQLRQVIHNLLANAQESIVAARTLEAARGADAAPPARVVVRTDAVAGAEPGAGAARAVRLAVEDEGPGFPANILRRAFEPYVTTKPSGTGLGLAMVKKIVDEHGARIELINRSAGSRAAGATVTIVFRRLVSDAAAAA